MRTPKFWFTMLTFSAIGSLALSFLGAPFWSHFVWGGLVDWIGSDIFKD